MPATKRTKSYVPIPKKSEDELNKSLKQTLEKGLDKIDNLDVDSFMGSVQVYISNEILVPCEYLKNRRGLDLTAEDYAIGYQAFEKLLSEINSKIVYTPTPITFAKFMGISWNTFKIHAEQRNERGEVVKMIMDSLTENHIQNMYGDKIHAIPAVFSAKALYGLKENDNPNVTINVNPQAKSIDRILKEYGMQEIE